MTSVNKEATLIVLLVHMIHRFLQTECCKYLWGLIIFFFFGVCCTQKLCRTYFSKVSLCVEGWSSITSFACWWLGWSSFPHEIPAAGFCCYLCIMSEWSHGYKVKPGNFLWAFCWFSEWNSLSMETRPPYPVHGKQHKSTGMRVGAGPPLSQSSQGCTIGEIQTFAALGHGSALGHGFAHQDLYFVF